MGGLKERLDVLHGQRMGRVGWSGVGGQEMKVLFVELPCLLLCSFYSFDGNSRTSRKKSRLNYQSNLDYIKKIHEMKTNYEYWHLFRTPDKFLGCSVSAYLSRRQMKVLGSGIDIICE